MPELHAIAEPRPASLARPALGAFLQMGFRPLYLAGASWAALSIAIWIFAPALAKGVMQRALWHAHEMLWGFIATIAVGFLLTAGATRTGINPLHGRTLGLLCCLWALARLGFLLPGRFIFVLCLRPWCFCSGRCSRSRCTGGSKPPRYAGSLRSRSTSGGLRR